MKKNQQLTQDNLSALKGLLKGKKRMAIGMQDNPDPDSIAAAIALRKLVHHFSNVDCSFLHGGSVGRAENRALVKYLNINLRHFEEVKLENYDLKALVDTQPGTGNNSYPDDWTPDIVIDHHPDRKATRGAKLHDVRKGYGATATILLEYLFAANIEPDVPTATAILYGIRSDTQDLGREACRADIEAIGYLYKTANNRMLSEIQRGRVARGYWQMLLDSLVNARIYDNAIVSNLGDIENADMIAETADLLMRDDEAHWVLSLGFVANKMLLSVRTSDYSRSAEKVAKKAVSRRGTAGGHSTRAGGQVILKKGTKTEKSRVEKSVTEKFLKALNCDETKAQKLVTGNNGS
jgi:nanoRNase/pAp phosphatase (c-di-AMP/oligoRNAs hydrolase)